MFISVSEIFDRPLHHREARINAGSRSLIKVAFENSGRRRLFVPEWRGTCMDMILWNLPHLLPSSRRLLSDSLIAVVKRLRSKNSILNTIYWLLFCCFPRNKTERRAMTRRCRRVQGVKTGALPAGRQIRRKEGQSTNCPLLPVSFWYQYSGLQKRQKELKSSDSKN
ncbi:hypothetical protein NGUA15_00439 [Salmonella enterica]|nr:hypothetical protein NGUA15_00439 [Salmonella enterica]